MGFFKKFGRYFLTRHFLKVAGIIILIHVIVIGSTIYYLDSFTNHGEKIEIPKLVGMNVQDVSVMLEEQGLKFEIIDRVYDPKLAEGTIIGQDPEETGKSQIYIKSGRTIGIRVSKRTSLVEMPALVDKSERFATTVLKNRGLRYKISYKNTPESSGAVIEQRYKGKRVNKGTKLPIGSMVQVIVGRYEGGEPILVVDLWGLTISEARERLSVHPGINFFPVCAECVTAEDSLRARIVAQSPEFFLTGEQSKMPSVGTVSATAVLNFVDNRPKDKPESADEITEPAEGPE